MPSGLNLFKTFVDEKLKASDKIGLSKEHCKDHRTNIIDTNKIESNYSKKTTGAGRKALERQTEAFS